MKTQTGSDRKFVDDLTDDELRAVTCEAMDADGFAVSWKIGNRLRSRGYDISPQGISGRLRRHPAFVYDYDYGWGRGRRAWRLRDARAAEREGRDA